jgi:hypothetical protein
MNYFDDFTMDFTHDLTVNGEHDGETTTAAHRTSITYSSYAHQHMEVNLSDVRPIC